MIKQDDELDKLEEDIRRLKNKYDQFFNGITKVPPSFERHQVEAMIHELSKQKMRDNTRRFRFNTVLSRFNQFREMWSRRMREREEGPLDFRRRQAAMQAEPEPEPTLPRVTSPPADAYVRMKPDGDGDEIRRLHQEIEQANRQLGKPAGVTLEQLEKMVRQQSDLVRQKYNVKTVAFRVETVDGKVKLKAKPLQD